MKTCLLILVIVMFMLSGNVLAGEVKTMIVFDGAQVVEGEKNQDTAAIFIQEFTDTVYSFDGGAINYRGALRRHYGEEDPVDGKYNQTELEFGFNYTRWSMPWFDEVWFRAGGGLEGDAMISFDSADDKPDWGFEYELYGKRNVLMDNFYIGVDSVGELWSRDRYIDYNKWTEGAIVDVTNDSPVHKSIEVTPNIEYRIVDVKGFRVGVNLGYDLEVGYNWSYQEMDEFRLEPNLMPYIDYKKDIGNFTFGLWSEAYISRSINDGFGNKNDDNKIEIKVKPSINFEREITDGVSVFSYADVELKKERDAGAEDFKDLTSWLYSEIGLKYSF